MKVEFKRGKEKDLPKEGSIGTLFFASDTGKMFEGNGLGKPLMPYSSILSGYIDVNDLRNINPQIKGKIYLTDDGFLYIFNGTDYISVGGGNISSIPTDIYEKNWNNQKNNELIKIIDMKNLFKEMNIRSISQSELIIYNPVEDMGDVQLYVTDREIPILDVQIKSKDTQKYILGISPNLKVFVKGLFTGSLYINYYSNN